MEALAAISLVGNLIQFLDLGSKLVSKSAQIYRSGQEALVENLDIEATTKDLIFVNEKLRNGSEQEGDDVLQWLCASCRAAAEEMLMIMERLKIRNSIPSKRTSIAKAIKSLWHKDQIDSLERRLAGYRAELNLHMSMQMRDEILLLKQQQPDLLEKVDDLSHNIINAIAEQRDVFQSGLALQLHDIKASQYQVVEKIGDEGKMSRKLMEDMNFKLDAIVSPYMDQVPGSLEKVILDKIMAELSGKLKILQHEPLVDGHRLREWLKPTHTEDKWQAARSAQVPGTSEWIINKDLFQQWVAPLGATKSMKILWVHGGPGFGKTVLCASILEHLNLLHPSRVAYFFCISDDEARRKPLAILRSWIAQLVDQHPEALDVVQEFYTRLNGSQGYQLRADDLWQILTRACQKLGNVFLVVDGFDECGKMERDTKQYTSESEDFLEQLVDMAVKTPGHLLLVSREDYEVRSQFRRLAEISPGTLFEHEVSHADTQDVMGAFALQAFNKRLRRQDQKVKSELAELAARRSQGMFLWVQLLVNRLKPDRPAKELRKIVSEAPVEINMAYENDLKRIMELDDERDRAVAILRWTFFAQRPLTVRELTEALAIDLEDESGEYPTDSLPDTWDEEDVNDRIRRLGGTLVELRDGENDSSPQAQTVHFVHFSVKEYLLAVGDIYRQSPQNVFFWDLNLENDLLARLCLQYLSYKQVVVSEAADETLIASRKEQFRFLVYAASHWSTHANDSKEWSNSLTRQVQDLFKIDSPACKLWAKIYEQAELASDPNGTHPPTELEIGTPVYYAAVLGLDSLLKFLLDNGQQVNGTGPFYGCALAGAAGRGHVECVKVLLEHSVDVNLKDGFNRTALGWTSRYNYHEIAKLLIAHQADMNIGEDAQYAPIHRASSEGHIEMVNLLLKSGAEYNTAIADKWTALHLAARSGYPQIVQCLLDHGAKMECRTVYGWTELHLAARNGYVDITKILLERGADINVQDPDEMTPLYLAAQNNHTEVVKVLLENGADINVRTNLWQTSIYSAAREGCLDVVKLLREKNANVQMRERSESWDALHGAVANDHLEVVKFLIGSGMDVDTLDKDQWTPCHVAAQNNCIEVLKVLLNNGAKLDAVTAEGKTPFSIAAQKGHRELLSLLFEMRVKAKRAAIASVTAADVDDARKISDDVVAETSEISKTTTEDEGPQTLHTAALKGMLDVLQTLTDKGVDIEGQELEGWTAMHCAAYSGRIEVIEFLLNLGASIDLATNDGETPLYFAALNGYTDVTKLLIDKGANVNACTTEGYTSLHRAVQNKHMDVIKILVESHADIEAMEKHRWTPLWLAAQNGYLEILKMLADAGAKTDVVEIDGWSAIHVAASNNHSQVLEYLLDRHPEGLNQTSNNGRTPIYLAAIKGHEDIAGMLLKRNPDLEISDDAKWTPLHAASLGGHVAVMKMLVEHNVKLDARETDGWTPIYVAAQSGHLQAIKYLIFEQNQPWDTKADNGASYLHAAILHNHIAVIEFFLSEFSADVDITDNEGWSLLFRAAQQGHVEMVNYLIDKGANVHLKEVDDWTTMHAAAQQNKLQIAKLLAEKGVSIFNQTKQGWTPLHQAAYYGCADVASWLLEQGSDVLAKQEGGWTCGHLAAQEGHLNILKMITDYVNAAEKAQAGARNSPKQIELDDNGANIDENLILAKEISNTTEATDICDDRNSPTNGVPAFEMFIDLATAENRTLLWVAATNGRIDVMKYLVEHGANVEVTDVDQWTLLHTAARGGSIEVVKYLVEETHADIDRVEKDGYTALALAAFFGKPEVVKYLADEAHADANVRNSSGRTALYYAILQGYEEIAKQLMLSADRTTAFRQSGLTMVAIGGINEQDLFGATLLHVAIAQNRMWAIDALLEAGADPIIPDGFGMTPIDWVEANPDLFAKLKSYSKNSHPKELLPRKRMLSDSICFLANRILESDDRTTSWGFYELGNCLKYFNEMEDVRTCFEQRMTDFDAEGNILQPVICNGCDKSDFTGVRFTCLTCPDMDFCPECRSKYTELDLLFCRNHEFVEFNTPADVEKQKGLAETISEDTQEFLRQIVKRYTTQPKVS